MAKRILEGLWDCPYCKTTAIGGLTKHCPCCGHPQDNGTKFYLGESRKYLEEDVAQQYGQGADWVCPYCGSLNRFRFQYCANCGAPKEESSADYFTAEKPAEPETPPAPPKKDPPKTKPRKKRLKWVLLIALAVFVAMMVALWPRNTETTVTDKSWQRTIDIEAYRTVEESDWSVPSGGRVFDQKREIHHYNQVLDHYETRYRDVAEQVYDGEDTYTSYSDNGDGTFTEHTHSRPRYRTEYRTESYEAPVYRQEPVYQTKYYYEIEKWVYDRTAKSGGGDDWPKWPNTDLKDNEREGQSSERYTMTVTGKDKDKSYTFDLSLDWWSKYRMGDSVTVTTTGGKVVKLDGEEIDAN